jgi:hypothetical protein
MVWWKEEDAIARSQRTTAISDDARSAKDDVYDIIESYRQADRCLEYWRNTHGKDAARR